MHTNQSVYCQAAKVRRPRARSKKRKKRRLVPAHRLPTQPDAANASPNWAGEEEPAACIDHRLRATRAISAEHYALAYVLLGGAPPHPRQGPALRRQRREAAGLARQAGSSLDCYGAAVRQVTVHGAGRGSAFECLLFGLPIEPDDAGLLCAHYRPKSECREDGHRECVHHCDLLKGRLIDLRRQ
jgi:hypothetical protein